ncbi:hypothetical protein [Arthrobacter gengyunqii]|nr:hypothetical protein [Arthrobacter gengyunqii]
MASRATVCPGRYSDAPPAAGEPVDALLDASQEISLYNWWI